MEAFKLSGQLKKIFFSWQSNVYICVYNMYIYVYTIYVYIYVYTNIYVPYK